MKLLITSILFILFALPAWAHDPPRVIGLLEGSEEYRRFGYDFTCIGDQNGDGYDDLMVSDNPTYRDEDPANEVQVFYGADTMENRPVFTHTIEREQEGFGYALQFLGNIIPNAPPFIAIKSIYHGDEASTHIYLYECDDERDNEPEYILSRSNEQYMMSHGRKTRPIDFNGDGIHDFIASEKIGDDSRFLVHFGSEEFDTIPDWAVVIPENGPYTVLLDYSSNYDVNGDGFEDILVLSSAINRGKWLSLYLGGDPPDTIPAFQVHENDYVEELRRHLNPYPGFSMLPDVNGDGYADWAVCATHTGRDIGYVMVFFGGEEPDTEPDLELECPVLNYGNSGDITGGYFNDDDYGDIVAGFGGGYAGDGELHVYFGSRWMTGDAAIQINAVSTYGDELQRLGEYVGAVGDYNSDGIDDFVARTGHTNRLAILAGSRRWRSNSVNDELPEEFSLLLDAYPNPFNDQTYLTFQHPFTGSTNIRLYDTSGRLVKIVMSEQLDRGKHSVMINGSSLVGGVYFVNVSFDSGGKQMSETIKVVYLP